MDVITTTKRLHETALTAVPPFVCFWAVTAYERGRKQNRQSRKRETKARRRGKEGEEDTPKIHLPWCSWVVYCLGLRKANCWKGPPFQPCFGHCHKWLPNHPNSQLGFWVTIWEGSSSCVLPGGLSPTIVPEEGGHGDCAKLNQKAENRFGWITAQAFILTSTWSRCRVTKGIKEINMITTHLNCYLIHA